MVKTEKFESYAEWRNFINDCKCDGSFIEAYKNGKFFYVDYYA